MEIQAALLREAKAAFSIETVQLDAPRADEVVVEIVACGLCHTDLSVRDGVIPFPALPNVLGHEGSGVVIAVGSAVRKVGVGDPVALSFASCGACPACEAGTPARCDNLPRRRRRSASCAWRPAPWLTRPCSRWIAWPWRWRT